MFAIAWKVEELKRLCAECRSLHTELNATMDLIRDPDTDFEQSNIPRQLTDLRRRLSASLKATYKYKRTPASHVFVFMISPEQRNQKPYALPVQCIPCASLKESDIRRLTSELAAEMVKRGMKVVGKCMSTYYYKNNIFWYYIMLSKVEIWMPLEKAASNAYPIKVTYLNTLGPDRAWITETQFSAQQNIYECH